MNKTILILVLILVALYIMFPGNPHLPTPEENQKMLEDKIRMLCIDAQTLAEGCPSP